MHNKRKTERHVFLVKRACTLGKVHLKPGESLYASDAAGDGSRWHVTYDHGGYVDTVDWPKLIEMEANDDISFDIAGKEN